MLIFVILRKRKQLHFQWDSLSANIDVKWLGFFVLKGSRLCRPHFVSQTDLAVKKEVLKFDLVVAVIWLLVVLSTAGNS